MKVIKLLPLVTNLQMESNQMVHHTLAQVEQHIYPQLQKEL